MTTLRCVDHTLSIQGPEEGKEEASGDKML